MTKLASLLSELRVVDLAKNEEETTKYFLLYKDKLFVLDKSSPFKTINSRLKSHVKSHPSLAKYGKERWSPLKSKGDITDFLNNMADVAPDVVVGEYYPENSAIVVWREVQPRSSLNIKKIAKQLGVQTITSRHLTPPKDTDVEINWSPEELVGDVPEVVYHGTTTTVLRSILKYGLDPGRGPSRFSRAGIYHPTHVFFTATFQEAIYYAFNAKHESKTQWDNYPIVLELTVPDRNKIYPDFDADFSTTTPRYYPKSPGPDTKSSMKSMGLSRETGKWGYKGRIPTSFIRWVYYYKPYEGKWHKSRPETWEKLLNHKDWEQISWKLGMQDMG